MSKYISPAFISSLVSSANIVEVIEEYISLKKTSNNRYVACCPFHQEKTPSFTVNDEDQFYHCFGCGASGNITSFLMEYLNLGYIEAVEDLAMRLKIDIVYESNGTKDYESSSFITNREKSDLQNLARECLDYYKNQLSDSSIALDYLASRDISKETIERYELGFSPKESYFSKKYKDNKDILHKLSDIGVIVNGESGYYDKFLNRVIFPIKNHYGKVVGFGGRLYKEETFKNGGIKPKYMNSETTPIYNKGRELYGLYEAIVANKEENSKKKNKIDKSFSSIIVVEGYLDVLRLAQVGITNVVAGLGTAFTEDQIDLLFKYTTNVIYCYDGDKAGRSAAIKALDKSIFYLTEKTDVSFLFLPDGDDPDSYIREFGKEEFLNRLNTSVTSYEAIVNSNSPSEDKLNVATHLFNFKSNIQSIIDKLPQTGSKDLLCIEYNKKLDELNQLSDIDLETFKIDQNHKAKNSKFIAKSFVKKVKNTKISNKTPMRVIIALLIISPVARELLLEFDDYFEMKLNPIAPGIELLQKLIKICRLYKGKELNRGKILANFSSEEQRILNNTIQVFETWNIDEDYIQIEFLDYLLILLATEFAGYKMDLKAARDINIQEVVLSKEYQKLDKILEDGFDYIQTIDESYNKDKLKNLTGRKQ
ncbi:MAG: DNA primase [Psittacicella sp.]